MKFLSFFETLMESKFYKFREFPDFCQQLDELKAKFDNRCSIELSSPEDMLFLVAASAEEPVDKSKECSSCVSLVPEVSSVYKKQKQKTRPSKMMLSTPPSSDSEEDEVLDFSELEPKFVEELLSLKNQKLPALMKFFNRHNMSCELVHNGRSRHSYLQFEMNGRSFKFPIPIHSSRPISIGVLGQLKKLFMSVYE